MTKLQLIAGVVYTELPPEQIRLYLQGGMKTGTINGYADEAKATPIIIAVHAIEWIHTS